MGHALTTPHAEVQVLVQQHRGARRRDRLARGREAGVALCVRDVAGDRLPRARERRRAVGQGPPRRVLRRHPHRRPLGLINWVPAQRRQLCWSHLKRDFKAFLDYGAGARRLGKRAMAR